jgi:hypothetical protein
MPTLVLQSHTVPLPAPWYERCVGSVREWSARIGYEYRWLGDELFDRLPSELRVKVADQPVVASDLARLVLAEEALAEGFERVIWVDADVLVLDPARFELPAAAALFGREIWVQAGENGKLKVYRKIHNAFMAFAANEPVLPFYRMSAERILSRYDAGTGPMVPQLIGPKLITLLHNAIGFDVLETAGMLSPLVAREVLAGGGPALDRFLRESAERPRALNLCGSSVRSQALSDAEMSCLVDRLQSSGLPG